MDRRTLLASTLAAATIATYPTLGRSEVSAEKVQVLKDRLISVKRPYSYKKIADPTGSAPTSRVERFELRGGDCSNAGDCKPRPLNGRMVSRTRTERVLFTNLKDGEEGIFSYYIYLPGEEYGIVGEPGSTMGQLLASLTNSWDSDSGPIFSLNAYDRMYVQLNEADTFEGRRANEKLITLGQVGGKSGILDRWINVEVRFGLSSGNDGYISVRFGGKSLGRFVGRTILENGGIEVRYGIYQTGTKHFAGGADAIPTQVVYYSNVQVFRLTG